jgi:Protein of unknown function (DUF3014)
MQDDSQVGKNSSKTTTLLVVVTLIIAAAAFYFFKMRSQEPVAESIPIEVPPSSAPTQEEEEPVVETPAYEAPAPVVQEKPLPPLGDSDNAALTALKELGGDSLLKLIVPQEVIRKFVLTVNNLSEGKVVHEYRPLVSPTPPFEVEVIPTLVEPIAGAPEPEPQYNLAAKNYERYKVYVTALALVDPDLAATTYKRFYPLISQAFKELGLKKPNFHSVMIAAIDNILAAPEVPAELVLVRPKVFYLFADPALEKLPQTHKLMLRMGQENARSVKASLMQLREKLIAK